MDEDWRGLDVEWLTRVSEQLRAAIDEAGGIEAALAGADREKVEEALDALRACTDAITPSTARPVMRTIDADPDVSPTDPDLEALAGEIGVDRGGLRHLSMAELMAEHADAPAEGMAIVEKLLAVGYHRREYPALGTTHRYHCRSHDDRAELRAQMTAWLASDG